MGQKQKNTLNLFRIVYSRFKKQSEEDWVKERRKACRTCEYNSLNQEKHSLKTKVLKFFSDALSYFAGKKDEDTLGNCTACDICSIYYKTNEELEICEKNKWKV